MKKTTKKTAKSTRKTSKVSRSMRSFGNLDRLVQAGVIIEQDRISEAEIAVINELEEEEVQALLSMYKKFSSRSVSGSSPFWRAFCF